MKRTFLIIDILFTILVPGFYGLLVLMYEEVKSQETANRINLAIVSFPGVLDVIITLILASSAYYLAKFVKNSTGKKQNTCLVIWHILNLLALTIVVAFTIFFLTKQYNATTQ